MIYGYARVSTHGQSVDAQVKQLRAAGAEKIFKETASGAKTDRPRAVATRPRAARRGRRVDRSRALIVSRVRHATF
jgi:DNA invertase Pin-like site-specific DNA recombinase